MSKVIYIITYPIRLLIIGLIYIYKLFISPIFGKCCRFTPTCSTYMLLSIKEWGIFKGNFIGLRRILKCNPFNKHCGIDLVPTNLKGEHKWIF